MSAYDEALRQAVDAGRACHSDPVVKTCVRRAGMALKYVSYRRVSTEEQGKSGLGLNAQARAFTQFVEDQGGEIIAEFIDEMSGKHDDRPGLIKAMVFAKKHNEEITERRKADAEAVE